MLFVPPPPPALPSAPPVTLILQVDRSWMPSAAWAQARGWTPPPPRPAIDASLLRPRQGLSPGTQVLLQAGLEILVTSLGGTVAYPRPLHPPVGREF